MRSLVVYSSRTGNTRTVAEAVYAVLPDPKEIYDVDAAPDPDGYDLIALGFWVDRGAADEKIQSYIRKIRHKKVGLFGTSGDYPDSDHTRMAVKHVESLLSDNHLIGSVMCQGKVDDAFADRLDDVAPASKDASPAEHHRLTEARNHPDETDLKIVQTAFTAMLNTL